MPPTQRILIVEDEDKLRRALRRGLTEVGYDVTTAEDGDRGLALATAGRFDLLILDLMLPGRDGLQILREVRAAGVGSPVLILSARGDVDDRVLGLDAGADDYLVKPFAWSELEARVRAGLRRRAGSEGVRLRAGDVELDRPAHRLIGGSGQAELTPREYRLLEYLMTHAGRVVPRDELAERVWDDPQAGLTNVIDVYVNYLRKKLEKVGAGGRIRTVRGVGYELRG